MRGMQHIKKYKSKKRINGQIYENNYSTVLIQIVHSRADYIELLDKTIFG